MQAPATEAFQGLSGSLIWLGLLHSLWLGSVMAALVAMVFQARRAPSHRARHATLCAALCGVALGPPLLTAAQVFTAARRSEGVATGTPTAAVVLPGSLTTGSREASPDLAPPHPGGDSRAVRLSRYPRMALDRATIIARAVRPFALTAWSLAAMGFAVVLALGVKGLNQLCRDASEAPPAVRERARKLGRLLRLGTIPAIRVHATLDEPCLCGVFRPVILLPGRWFAAARADAVEAVLAHELAHARRRDHLVNLAQRVLDSVLFFHPGVHWLSRSLRRERELCSDALAVRITGDPLALARALESVASLRVTRPRSRLAGATLLSESSSLLPRIQELIGMTPIRPRPQVWPYVALPSAVALALVTVSVGAAGDGPAPSPSTSPPSSRATQVDRPTEVTPSAAPAIPNDKVDRMPVQAETVQISYEVRFIELEPGVWRHRLEGRLKPLYQEEDNSGWILDKSAYAALLEHIQGEAASNVLRAPKVTAFENGHAFILARPEWTQPAPGTTSRPAETGAGGPAKKEGVCADLTGSRSPQGVRLLVRLGDSTLVPGRAGRESDPEAVPPSGRPASKVVYYEGSSDVPDGSSLAISLGRHASGGGARPAMSERLVVITPRRIVIESEEKPRNVKPADEPASRPETR